MPVFFGGVPAHFRLEPTGELSKAVMAYLDHRLGERAEPTAEQTKLIADYLNYYICAPCWEFDKDIAERLHTLRVQSQTLATCDEIAAWIRACLDLGIDPL